jgi:hypothetical protein
MQMLSCEQVYNIWISEPNLIRIVDLREREAYERQHIPGAISAGPASLPAVIYEHKHRLLVLFGEELMTEDLTSLLQYDCVIMKDPQEWFKKGWPSAGLQGVHTIPPETDQAAPEILIEEFCLEATQQRAWLLLDHHVKEACILDAHDGIEGRWRELQALGYRLCLLFRSQSQAQALDFSLSAKTKARLCIPRDFADAQTDIPLESGQEILFGERLIRVSAYQACEEPPRLEFAFCGKIVGRPF